MVTQFLERYFPKFYTKSDVRQDSAVETDTHTVRKDSADGSTSRRILRQSRRAGINVVTAPAAPSIRGEMSSIAPSSRI